ncbi:MAG: DMT family transporter [Anaerolineae bacterium]|nr:DMT family transporter [Anaerolineae bacterium]
MTEYATRTTQYVSRITQRGSRQLLADAALLGVTAIWGATFVMVKDAVASFPVFSFMTLRFVCAALVLLPFVLLRQGGRGAGGQRGEVTGGGLPARSAPPSFFSSPSLLLSSVSLLIGIALFAGYAFQTAGLHLTTPAKAGFITGLSVVIVPVVAALWLRQAPERNAWLGVGLAMVGLALLSLQNGLAIASGDLLVFCCALAFAAHILLTGRFAPQFDPVLLTFGQIVVVMLLSGVAALLFDVRPAGGLTSLFVGVTGQVLFAAVFTGLFATSLAFGVQTVAQRFTSATHTALIFAAEPVFAALFSFLLIGELLGPRQLFGCGLILAGMVVAEMRPVR